MLFRSAKSHRTAQHFAGELKFGPYSPNIDSTPGLTGKPFSDLYNNQYGTNFGLRPAGDLLTTLEVDQVHAAVEDLLTAQRSPVGGR